MALTRLVFRKHALQRMFQRGVTDDDVRRVVEVGEIIEEYLDDAPLPSRLVLGMVEQRPLHVVAADNLADGETIIVTVYEPDPARWEPGFKRRKTS